METLTYAARIEEPEPGEFLVTFEDVPEAITGGSSYDEALELAPDCLATAIEGYLKDRLPLPHARPAGEGEVDVPVPPTLAARAILLAAMEEQGLSGRALGQRMDRDEKTVRRILTGRNASFELTLQALQAVGVRPALTRVRVPAQPHVAAAGA